MSRALFRKLINLIVLAVAACITNAVYAQAATDATPAGSTSINGSIPWAMDDYHGKAELVPVHHATVKVNRHTGENIVGSLAGSFLYRPQLSTEIAGEHAKTQLHSLKPVLYFRVTEDDDPGGENNGDKMMFAVVPAKIEKDHRVVTQISFNQFTTRGKRKDDIVPGKLEKLKQGWVRITFDSELAPGEYVFLEQPERGSSYATTVFPFGIDAQAPEAADAVAPATAGIPGLLP